VKKNLRTAESPQKNIAQAREGIKKGTSCKKDGRLLLLKVEACVNSVRQDQVAEVLILDGSLGKHLEGGAASRGRPKKKKKRSPALKKKRLPSQ